MDQFKSILFRHGEGPLVFSGANSSRLDNLKVPLCIISSFNSRDDFSESLHMVDVPSPAIRSTEFIYILGMVWI